MGRKRKFGEESDFVSVRVPKSKRKKYRTAIKNFVEKKFAHLSRTLRTPYHEIVKLAKKVGIIKTGYEGVFLASREEYEKVGIPSLHKFKWQCGKCHEIFEMDITHCQSTAMVSKLY